MLDIFQFGKRAFKRALETPDGRLVVLDVKKFAGAHHEDVYCSPEGKLYVAIDSGLFSAGESERAEALGRLRVYQRVMTMSGTDPSDITEAERQLLERFAGRGVDDD